MLHMTVVLAQQVTISGQVLDEKSEPLIGATVNIEGTTNAVITDLEGKFTLKALPSEKIVISYLGYKPKTVAIGKNRKFNITLDPSVTEMDEIVVVGYGSQRKSDIATAVASVNIKDIAKSSSAQTSTARQNQRCADYPDRRFVIERNDLQNQRCQLYHRRNPAAVCHRRCPHAYSTNY